MTYRQRLIRSIPPLFLSMAAWADAMPDQIEGTIRARVLSVIDGDSFRVHVCVWHGIVIYDLIIRLHGIDAPELRGSKMPARSRNRPNKGLAQKAKERLTQLVGRTVRLKRVRRGKYSGRFIAEVYTGEELHLSLILLRERLAIPYQSAQPDPWCEEENEDKSKSEGHNGAKSNAEYGGGG